MKKIIVVLLVFYGTIGFSQNPIINEFAILGNKKLKTTFIKKISSLKPEMVLDSTLIEKDIKRLKRLPSVSHAYFQVVYLSDNSCNVTYNIVENFTIIPSINIYTTSDREIAYRIGLYEFNLFGQNIAIGGFYQNDIYSSYAINFKAPFLFSKHFGLALNHQNLTTQEPVFLTIHLLPINIIIFHLKQ